MKILSYKVKSERLSRTLNYSNDAPVIYMRIPAPIIKLVKNFTTYFR